VLHVDEGYVVVLASAGYDLLGRAEFENVVVKFLFEKKVNKKTWKVEQGTF